MHCASWYSRAFINSHASRNRRFHFHDLIPEASLKYSLYSSLLLTLALSACGGGSSDSAPTANMSTNANTQSSGGASTQLLASSPQVIGYYGDSTIWGLKSGTTDIQVATPAPVAFAQALAGTAQHTVTNKGVNGSTACDLLNGNAGLGINNNWTTEMAGAGAAGGGGGRAGGGAGPGAGGGGRRY